MVRRANRKSKGRPYKEERKIVLIATEGINKTEQSYFSEFNRIQSEYHIVFASGNSTDPVRIVKDAIRTIDNRGIRIDYGDSVYAIFDTDFNKEEQIRDARNLARKNQVSLILSNPWFEVISELINRWPEYRKNIGTFQYISDRTDVAIENSRKLESYHEEVNPRTNTEDRNPSTDIFKLVEEIYPKGGDEAKN